MVVADKLDYSWHLTIIQVALLLLYIYRYLANCCIILDHEKLRISGEHFSIFMRVPT